MTHTTDYRKTYPSGTYTVAHLTLGDIKAYAPNGELLYVGRLDSEGNVRFAENAASEWTAGPKVYTGDYISWPDGVYQHSTIADCYTTKVVVDGVCVAHLGEDGYARDPGAARRKSTPNQWHRVSNIGLSNCNTEMK